MCIEDPRRHERHTIKRSMPDEVEADLPLRPPFRDRKISHRMRRTTRSQDFSPQLVSVSRHKRHRCLSLDGLASSASEAGRRPGAFPSLPVYLLNHSEYKDDPTPSPPAPRLASRELPTPDAPDDDCVDTSHSASGSQITPSIKIFAPVARHATPQIPFDSEDIRSPWINYAAYDTPSAEPDYPDCDSSESDSSSYSVFDFDSDVSDDCPAVPPGLFKEETPREIYHHLLQLSLPHATHFVSQFHPFRNLVPGSRWRTDMNIRYRTDPATRSSDLKATTMWRPIQDLYHYTCRASGSKSTRCLDCRRGFRSLRKCLLHRLAWECHSRAHPQVVGMETQSSILYDSCHTETIDGGQSR
ncbi:hypothetical protein BV25DRAFT_1829319 [Artomyces pyxidatus]|uniref:Uncharacterized protein n=1 Tax=Artomyces pyxidatus TaxID=48021 RepID=A0ACB8SSB7_9AGAM|nr:hypothetical protein BV25DRAFT_1829319 [Artomyces pyxidatus]